MAGRNVAVMSAESHTITMVYDAADRNVAIINGRGYAHSMSYDVAGRMVAETDQLGRITTSVYDNAGRVVLKHTPRDIVTTYVYDSNDRLIERVYPSDKRDSFTYDEVDRQTVMTDSVGATTNTYGARGEVLAVVNPFGKSLTYTYDPVGQRLNMEGSHGYTTYSYDPAGRQVALIDPRNRRSTFTYNESGKIVNKQTTSLNVTHVYDAAGWLTNIENYKHDGAAQSIFTYSYDSVGNRLSQEALNGDRNTWTYDNTYQLTREQLSGVNEFDITYEYDSEGNRLVETDNLSSEITTGTFNAANELLTREASSGVTTYTYDFDGNRTRKETPTELTTYEWNETGLMSAAEPVTGEVTFRYTADGQRVEKTTPTETKQFLYNFTRLAEEHAPNGNAIRDYTFGPEILESGYGDLISEYDFGDTENFDHTYNAQWSTDALIDENNLEKAAYQYRAFGSIANQTGSSDTNMLFVGKHGYYADGELELYYLGASNNIGGGRHYDPVTGAMNAKDRKGLVAGDANLYRYVYNHATNDIDPSGQEVSFRLGHSSNLDRPIYVSSDGYYFVLTRYGRAKVNPPNVYEVDNPLEVAEFLQKDGGTRYYAPSGQYFELTEHGRSIIPNYFTYKQKKRTIATRGVVCSGVVTAKSYHQDGLFTPPMISSHGFILVDGESYGGYEKQNHVTGTFIVKTGWDELTYPKKEPWQITKLGQRLVVRGEFLPPKDLDNPYYSLRKELLLCPTNYDPYIFRAAVLDHIQRIRHESKDGSMTYIPLINDCNVFVENAVNFGFSQSQKTKFKRIHDIWP